MPRHRSGREDDHDHDARDPLIRHFVATSSELRLLAATSTAEQPKHESTQAPRKHDVPEDVGNDPAEREQSFHPPGDSQRSDDQRDAGQNCGDISNRESDS